MLAISFLAASWASPDAGGARQRPPVRAARARAPAMALPALPALQPAVLRASAASVGDLLTCCGLGFAATRYGLIDKPSLQALSRIVYRVFLPSLLLTNVATTVASGALRSLLPIPIAAWVQISLGLLVASALLPLLRIKRDSPDGKEVQVLSAFGNSGVLPLLFVERLFAHAADATLKPRAISYVSMFLLGWSPAFWTGGYALLGGTLGDEAAAREKDGAQAAARQTTPTALRWPLSLLSTPTASRVLTPPIIACMCGLVVGAVPPLRALLLPPAAGGAAPLPFYSCLQTFGKAYAPAALLVLAGSLASADAAKKGGGGTKGDGDGYLRHRVPQLVAISLARFALVPLATAALLAAASAAGLVPADPLLHFMLLMQSCMPSAQNSVLALQVRGAPERATLMARMLLVVYVAAAVPLSLLITCFLQATGVGAML